MGGTKPPLAPLFECHDETPVAGALRARLESKLFRGAYFQRVIFKGYLAKIVVSISMATRLSGNR